MGQCPRGGSGRGYRPPGRRAAGPPGRRAAGPPGRRAAGPPGRRAAGPWTSAAHALLAGLGICWQPVADWSFTALLVLALTVQMSLITSRLAEFLRRSKMSSPAA
jgi:hypothetical protein